MARSAVVALLSLAFGLCTGCFVFDEIDQGREVMKKHSGASRRPAAAAAPSPPAPAAAPHATEAPEEEQEEGPGLFARLQQYLQDRRDSSSAPERDPEDGIVTCVTGDGLTFTHESDCLARGGTPR
jgi:hypothetical protein